MSIHRHEIPTHLNVEDRAFYGLSARQVMVLSVGASSAYSLWTAWDGLPFAPRVALAVACVLLAVLLALVRPHGRGLEEWLFVALHYLAMPRVSLWQPSQSDPAPRIAHERWADLSLAIAWDEEDR